MSVTGKLKQPFVISRVAHNYSQPESKFIQVEDARLHFVIRGSGRPVVLIHGNPGSWRDWTRVYAPLASDFCVVAFDRPGHGHSGRPEQNGNATVEVQARLLNSALAELGVERPILVGHSWGGALALIYALSYPDAVSGLVLVAPAAYESDDGVSFLSKLPAWPVIGDILNTLFTPLLSAWMLRTELARAFAPDKVPKSYLRHALTEWTRPGKVKWYSVDEALLDASLAKFSPGYARLRLPVAIVTGDSDLIVPAKENAFRLVGMLSHAKLQVLENVGHQIPFVRPEAVVAAVGMVAEMAPAA
jgi:pimeloyl-ACP methyl ester carboxylesterase